MYEDVPNSNMPNKVRVIELVNENVTVLTRTKNFKRAVFTVLFFYLYKNH